MNVSYGFAKQVFPVMQIYQTLRCLRVVLANTLRTRLLDLDSLVDHGTVEVQTGLDLARDGRAVFHRVGLDFETDAGLVGDD